MSNLTLNKEVFQRLKKHAQDEVKGGLMENTGRRKFERRYLVAEVQLRKEEGGSRVNAMAVNISDDGIGLYTTEPLEEDEKVTVKVTVLIRGTLIVTEEVPGTVRWVEPIDRNYAAGVKFGSSIVDSEFPVLHRCLEYARAGQQPG